MNSWFEKIVEGCDVERFHTKKLIHRESVGEHSFRCSLFADYLYTQLTGKKSYNVVMYMLLHDLPECDMGDVPHHSKKDVDLNEALDQFEEEWCVNHLPTTQYIRLMNHTDLTDLEQLVCLYTDRYDACLKFIREYQLGNKIVLKFIRMCIDDLYELSNNRPILMNEIENLQELIDAS